MDDKPKVDVTAEAGAGIIKAFSDGASLPVKYRISATYLMLPDGIEFNVTEGLVRRMKGVSDSIRFWLGDLLNYAERNYHEMFSQLLDDTDYSERSIRDMMLVSREVEPTLRREGLTWSHHREVAGLPREEQKCYLEKAESDGLSVLQLRHLVKPQKPREPKQDKSEVYETALRKILADISESSYFNAALFEGRDPGCEMSESVVFCTELAKQAAGALMVFRDGADKTP